MANLPPLSDYERMRADRIERNNARIASLGLLDVRVGKTKPASTPNKKKRTVAVTPSPTRASKRVKHPIREQGQVCRCPSSKVLHNGMFLGTVTAHDTENDWFTIVYDDADKEDFTREELMEALVLYQREGMGIEASAKSAKIEVKAKSKFKCENPLNTSSSPLSAIQKKNISDRLKGDFLGKFEEYLTDVDVVSESNRRNVLRQITKLANGEGIRYDSKAYGWPEGCYFMKGVKIGPRDDILELMDMGQECENEWGRDHGNGWLLSHPLKKLYQFQQYCLEEKIIYI
ncbi:hypothetical protein ACHAXN_000465 [Cyclotella atomus]